MLTTFLKLNQMGRGEKFIMRELKLQAASFHRQSAARQELQGSIRGNKLPACSLRLAAPKLTAHGYQLSLPHPFFKLRGFFTANYYIIFLDIRL